MSENTANNVVLEIYRFDPLTDQAPRYDKFTVPFKKGLSLLDALIYVYEQRDPSLAFRWSCQNVQCGTCGVLLNGEPALSCEATLQAGQTARVDPFPLPVVKDLVTDLSSLEDIAVRTFSRPVPAGRPARLLPQEVSELAPLHQCLDCHICDVICPINKGQERIGLESFVPSGLVQLASVVLDKREGENRIELAHSRRVYDCLTCGACTRVCPAHIEIDKDAILPLRREAVKDGGTKHGAWLDPKDWVERWIEPQGELFLDSSEEYYRVPGAKGEVAFFVGCLANRRQQSLAEKTIRALNQAHFDVVVPKGQGCCGQPLTLLGMPEKAEELLRQTLSVLVETGVKQVVTCCPECSYALRGHWLPIDATDAQPGFEVLDLVSLMPTVALGAPGAIACHNPCYLSKQETLLSDELAKRGVEVEEVIGDCCGAGGGVYLTNADLSRQVGIGTLAGLSSPRLVTGCPLCLERFAGLDDVSGSVSHYVDLFIEPPQSHD